MKKKLQNEKKLSLKKLQIAKITNLKVIKGGGNPDNQHDTDGTVKTNK